MQLIVASGSKWNCSEGRIAHLWGDNAFHIHQLLLYRWQCWPSIWFEWSTSRTRKPACRWLFPLGSSHVCKNNCPYEKFDNLFNDNQHTTSTFFLGNDNTALQAEHDTLDDLIQDFGVYTDDVDIIFDEEELSDSDNDEDQQTQQEATNMVRILTEREWQDIYEDLLRLNNNGKLKRDCTTLIAAKYNIHVCTIQRVWQREKSVWNKAYQ